MVDMKLKFYALQLEQLHGKSERLDHEPPKYKLFEVLQALWGGKRCLETRPS